MSNEISNERLEQIASGKWDGVRGSELDAIANELLELRKQVRSAEEELNALADVAGSNAAHIKRLQR